MRGFLSKAPFAAFSSSSDSSEAFADPSQRSPRISSSRLSQRKAYEALTIFELVLLLSPGCHNGQDFWKIVSRWNMVTNSPTIVTNFPRIVTNFLKIVNSFERIVLRVLEQFSDDSSPLDQGFRRKQIRLSYPSRLSRPEKGLQRNPLCNKRRFVLGSAMQISVEGERASPFRRGFFCFLPSSVLSGL